MKNHRPVTQLPISAAPGFWPGPRAFWMLILAVGILGATALAAPAPQKQAVASTQPATLPAGYVGSETCASCHEAVAKGFADNPHTKMALMHGDAGVTCENCHGPGEAHVESGGDVTKIFDPAKHSAKEVNAMCEKCHAATHPDFNRSPHAKAGLSCISCHQIHNAPDKAQLLRASQPALCYQCHADLKARFSMPFHHPVPEGVVRCSDCHDVHGTFQSDNLRTTADQNAVCTKCHTDVRGPFVFEHAPVKAEGCMACHTPHGSENARLLNMPNVNVLCNQCHSQVAADTVHGMSAGSSDSVPCTSCHTYIHGSNMSAAFLR